MFRFLRGKPTCPVHPAAKAWVEGRLDWLFEQFGSEVFLSRPLVLPSRELVPEGFDYSDAAVRALLDRVCRLMGVDGREIELKVAKPEGDRLWLVNGSGQAVPSGFGGLYQGEGRIGNLQRGRTKISINTDELLDLAGLIGTMAHELSHHRLLGEGRLLGDEFDHELTTDLTTIFHGFGAFIADGHRIWAGTYNVWPGTDVKRPEYITPPICGYALAHQAWLAGEASPAWAKQLSYDVRAAFKQALRFLTETGDSSLAHRRIVEPDRRVAGAGPE